MVTTKRLAIVARKEESPGSNGRAIPGTASLQNFNEFDVVVGICK